MNCKQSEKIMTIAVFGTLNQEDETALKEHISRCHKCAQKWEKTAQLRKRTYEDPVLPLPDPERSWAVISKRLSKDHHLSLRVRTRHWIPVAAALLLVFAAGFFFGRRMFLVSSKGLTFPPLDLSEASLESYADYLQPVLINFLNQSSLQNPKSVRQLEQHIVSDLLDRTRLLKSLIPEDGHSDLRELLQDLEFILTAMDNLEADDRDTARHLIGLIREKEVSLRLHQLIKTQSTI
jgi:hypothetical protein